MILARVVLHGFPDLGLPGGSRPFVKLELSTQVLTGRDIIEALLARFGESTLPFLVAARSAGKHPANMHFFVAGQQIGDLDEDLGTHIDAEGQIEVLLIHVKKIVGG